MVKVKAKTESILSLLIVITITLTVNANSNATARYGEGTWSFIVLADWHGAETFAVKPGTDSKTWKRSLSTLNHIKQNYGGDLVILPGDSNSGKWTELEFIEKFNSTLTPKQAVLKAGRNYYGTVKSLFSEAGYDTILMAVGDHELGGNAWNPGSTKLENLDTVRQTFTKWFNTDAHGNFLFGKSIGSAMSRPIGTAFETTSYAYQHKNVLFVTVDAFKIFGSGDTTFMDRENGRGGEGAVSCTVTGDHLIWFENVLSEARKDPTIKHIIVQAHVPIIQPVRKVVCSGQFLDLGEDSDFWKIMQKYSVDIYFAGEVHANTVRKDSSSNLIQIVARGNSFNNFHKVTVTDDAIQIKVYNEIGELPRFNNNYEVYGELILYKWATEMAIEATGELQIVDSFSETIRLNFEEIVPLSSRQVMGMIHDDVAEKLVGSRITVRGVQCKSSMPNEGSFGQLYDAQVANVALVPGRESGKFAGEFKPSSRLAFFGTGPHSGGNLISFALWLKTSVQSREMILVHYGAMWDGETNTKDIFTLTLGSDGTPRLYTSSKKILLPVKWSKSLTDGKWHHIAVSMPRKSCYLSDTVLYIDGKEVTSSVEVDERIFHITSGRLSLGGFGYTSEKYEEEFPNMKPFKGILDEFQLWSRSINSDDLPKFSVDSSFNINRRKQCVKTGTETMKSISKKKCHEKCLSRTNCLGYEFNRLNGQKECYFFSETPEVMPKKTKKALCVQVST